jgi:hypothetical protein
MKRILVTIVLLSCSVVLAEERIEFYFFGRHECGFSQKVVSSGDLPGILTALRTEAQLRGANFESYCVALDNTKEIGERFVAAACRGFDRTINTGEGFETVVYRECVHSPPSLDGNAIPDGDLPVPLAVTIVRRDGEILVNRWPSWIINKWADQLREKEEGTRLGDDMKPIIP